MTGGKLTTGGKPRLGQYWLTDTDILGRIVALAQLESDDTVLEIGTGLGHLTKVLLSTPARVVSLEYDSKLYRQNLAKYQSINYPNLQLLCGDIRGFDWSTLPAEFKICANIPYYLTAHLLRILTELAHKPKLAILLIPQAIARKLTHEHKKSLLSVLTQTYYKVSLDQVVEREAFQPIPQITSQVIVLQSQPVYENLSQRQWQQLVKLYKFGFSSPRKQLKSNLRAALKLSRDEMATIFMGLGFDLKLRAEDLNHQQWGLLLESLKPYL